MTHEHIIHFKVTRKGETKQLRGLIFLEDNTEPTLQDYEQCLKQCGHDARVSNAEQLIFQATDGAESYLIHIMKNYGQNNTDRHAQNLAKSFMKPRPFI
ncbi:MAG: hypothetical protein ACE3L7_28020 [Candidatus Pristimantibacillus sp.]